VTRLKGDQFLVPGGYDEGGKLTTDPKTIEETRRILPQDIGKVQDYPWHLISLRLFSPMEGQPVKSISWIKEAAEDAARFSSLSIPRYLLQKKK